MPRRLQLDDAAIIRAYQVGATMAQVGKQFGVSTATVQRRVRRASSVSGRRPDQDAIIAAYRAGASLRAVAQQFGISPPGVAYVLQQAEVPRRSAGRPQGDHGAIISAYERGVSVRALTQRCGCSGRTIYSILHRAGIPLRSRHTRGEGDAMQRYDGTGELVGPDGETVSVSLTLSADGEHWSGEAHPANAQAVFPGWLVEGLIVTVRVFASGVSEARLAYVSLDRSRPVRFNGTRAWPG